MLKLPNVWNFYLFVLLQSAVSVASSNEDSTPTCVYHAVMRGLERLVVSFALSSAESDSLVKLSVDRWVARGANFDDCSSFRSIFLLVQSPVASIVIRVWGIVSFVSCACAISFPNHRPCLKRQRVPPCLRTISLKNTYEDTNFRVILFFASQIIDAKSSESDIWPWAAGHLYVYRYGPCSLLKIVIIFKLIDEKGLSRFWGNQTTRRKTSTSGWGQLKLSPYTTIAEVGGVIDDHNTSLTPYGIQQEDFQVVTHPVINLLQQGLT